MCKVTAVLCGVWRTAQLKLQGCPLTEKKCGETKTPSRIRRIRCAATHFTAHDAARLIKNLRQFRALKRFKCERDALPLRQSFSHFETVPLGPPKPRKHVGFGARLLSPFSVSAVFLARRVCSPIATVPSSPFSLFQTNLQGISAGGRTLIERVYKIIA